MHSHLAETQSGGGRSKFRLYAVLTLTCGYFVAEIVGGLLTGSLALLADAGHMLTDIFGMGMSVAAMKLGEKPANARKTYGYLRGEILAALANGAMMVAVAVGIVFEAFRRFREPPQILGGWMLVVAGCGLLVNLVSAALLRHDARQSINLRGAYLEVLGDLLGSIGALVAAAIVMLSGWRLADPIVGVGIGLFIVPRAWRLIDESLNILLEGAPQDLDLPALRRQLEELPGVVRVHDLHAWAITSGKNTVSGHLAVHDPCDAGQILAEAHRALRDQFQIEHATLQVEPLDFDASLEPQRHA